MWIFSWNPIPCRKLLNKAEYIGKISAYDRQKLDEYVATKEQIQAKEAELEAEHGELLGFRSRRRPSMRRWSSSFLPSSQSLRSMRAR